ncbi:hypothetical protein R078138_00331 [Convivina praedatoris]|uniref:Uncharacterized protein n=1 Tax=Convivina praedatoris TaxID=2880963 RepID=A0ABN8H6Q0_9LACO|nr:hypothetical protein LMG032447_00001 [Convivina sp. LMG 32447]CAH1851360.1 hypothetical protein R078138_00331 [Convivina sp. LMG 32447]CAH1857450.1 hypothetical protein R077815_01569 [Convivina sp. LMG 32447]
MDELFEIEVLIEAVEAELEIDVETDSLLAVESEFESEVDVLADLEADVEPEVESETDTLVEAD